MPVISSSDFCTSTLESQFRVSIRPHLVLRAYSGCRIDKESRKTSYGAPSVVVVMTVIVVAAVGRERWN